MPKHSKVAKTQARHVEIVAIASILLIVTLVVLNQSIPEKLAATFETAESTCLGEEPGDMDIRAVGTSIIIVAPIQTPNPCYDVAGEATLSDGNILVDMRTVARNEICIQCVGVVTARVTIPDLPAGTYGLDVRTPYKATLTTITVGAA